MTAQNEAGEQNRTEQETTRSWWKCDNLTECILIIRENKYKKEVCISAWPKAAKKPFWIEKFYLSIKVCVYIYVCVYVCICWSLIVLALGTSIVYMIIEAIRVFIRRSGWYWEHEKTKPPTWKALEHLLCGDLWGVFCHKQTHCVVFVNLPADIRPWQRLRWRRSIV